MPVNEPGGRPGAPGTRPSLRTAAVVGCAGSVGLALSGSRVGADPRGAGWWFSVPRGNGALLGVLFYVAAGLLVAAWVGVGVRARAGQLTTRQVWVLLGLWAGPLLLGPPLFSRDLYSYVAQGLIAHRGLDPYGVGPSVLGPGPVLGSVAAAWRHTPAPYGPLFVGAARSVATVFGRSLTADVLAMRVLELVGLAMTMRFLPRLARNLGADPGVALWLGVLSPLALFSFVASGHNDGLMLGLLIGGLALASEKRPTAALCLCALAVTVKLPAAAAIVFVGVGWLRSTRGRARLRALALVAAVPVATVAAVTYASGLGWSWLGPGALRVPTEQPVPTTPSVALGTLVSHLLGLVGVHVDGQAAVTVTQEVCGGAALIAVLWLVLHVRRFDEVRLLGCALAVMVLAGPTVWPWYLLWGLSLLAATPAQRSRAVAVVAAFAMLLVTPSGAPILQGDAYLVVVGGCALGGLWLVRDRHWATVALGSVV
ncbi:MAG TPA: polyprenol phosphomannose-dependent alpha 1,6 mannosyltransferase MptB [Acidimicrobiales bacterium]|nr:polyprenol phosphomannose-dependent alpha 1,6 mannosyltransferase MptB [Acidimicrobiales bacterium]